MSYLVQRLNVEDVTREDGSTGKAAVIKKQTGTSLQQQTQTQQTQQNATHSLADCHPPTVCAVR